MNNNLTLIAMVLDRSGSMSTVLEPTIAGVNKFLDDQRKEAGECMFHMAQFDDKYDVVHSFKNLKEVPNLDTRTYVPRGWTALLDAIGNTIDEVGKKLAATPEEFRPGKVVFVVQTDGAENASTKFTREAIKEKIDHQTEKYNWQFVFLGANQDAIQSGAWMGFQPSMSLSYAPTRGGSAAVFNSSSQLISSYRKVGSVSVKGFSASDRAAAVEDDSDADSARVGGLDPNLVIGTTSSTSSAVLVVPTKNDDK